MTLIAIDPGTTQSAYVIVDAALRPVEFQKIDNAELLSRIELAPRSETRWRHLTSCAIEMPAVAMMSGVEIFTTCRWVGMFQHAWIGIDGDNRYVDLVTRHHVKMHLLGRTSRLGRGADAAVRAALIAKHGGPSSIKRGGEIEGVTGDCWAALAVAHTAIEAPRGTPPGSKDAARRQHDILWNTGTSSAP